MKAIYDEAIQITNDSRYGLHTCVFGIDLERVRRVASRIRAGRVLTNGMMDDPQAPICAPMDLSAIGSDTCLS